MARRKGPSKSNDSDQGWRVRQRQQIAHTRDMVENDRNVASMSSSSANPTADNNADHECQKTIHKESSPPDIFNNSSSLKYLHKKFKRVASAVIEENCEKVRTLHANANLLSTDIPSKYDAASLQLLQNNLNLEMLVDPVSAAQSSHINENETNSHDVVVVHTSKCVQCRKSLDERQHSKKCCNECNPELINAATKYGHGVLRNVFSKNDTSADLRTSGAVTRTAAAAAAAAAATAATVQHISHKQYDTDFIDSLGKCKNDSSIRIITASPLQQQKTNKHYELTEVFRAKFNQLSSVGSLPHKENLSRATQLDLSIQSINTDSRNNNTNDTGSSSANAANKSFIRRKNNDKPYPCNICGIEFKSRSQYYKHCRSTSHGIKGATNNAQLPNEDIDLDISQSTSSDLELSSCSTTTNSDALSRSTTPLGEAHGISNAALNYSLSSQGQSGTHSIGSIAVPDRPYKPKFHKAVYYQSNAHNNNITDSISQSDDSKPKDLVVKGKHGETINDNTTISHQPLSTQSINFIEHISKIISQNEAIMEGVEPALQKKYHKITGIPRGGNSNVNNSTEMQMPQSTMMPSPAKQSTDDLLLKMSTVHEPSSMESLKNSQRPFPTLQQQAQQALRKSSHSITTKTYSAINLTTDAQPLNLTSSAREQYRKKSTSNDLVHAGSPVPSTSHPTDAGANQFIENHHPQNPERSIIKSLLLNSRGLAVPTAGEGEDAVYTCPLCNISFRSADNLQYHTKCYCQGTPQIPLANQVNGSPQSAPISPVGSPSHKFFRSNSFNLLRPEKYSPSTLAKLASSSLMHHRTPLSLAKLAAQQAAGYYLNKSSQQVPISPFSSGASSSRSGMENFKPSASNVSTSPSTFNNATTETQSVSSQCVQITKQLMDASLPSPGPLLGKTRLVDHYNAPRTTNKPKETVNKSETSTSTVATESALSLVDISKIKTTEDSFASRNQKLLQMCGGEITIVEKTEEKLPRFGSSGGSIVSISSSSPDSLPENSPLSIRTGLLSGGSIIESPILAKRKPNPTTNVPSSPANVQPFISNLSRNIMANYFQFPPPPINSITAYNPLTLPPKQQPEFNSDLSAAIEATKIIHGGKIIPFVPGIPGPNSLSANAPISPIVPTISNEKFSDRIYNIPSQNATSLFAGNISLGAAPFRSMNLSISSSVLNSPSLHAAKRLKSPEAPPKVSITKSQSSSESDADSANHPHNLSTTLHNPCSSATGRDGNATISEKPFNFMRIADNLSPPKIRMENANNIGSKIHGDTEVCANSLDKLKPRPKALLQLGDVTPLHITIDPPTGESSQMNAQSPNDMSPEKIKVPLNIGLEKNNILLAKHPAKFLRPTSLPLKPGTFTPKKHHGITPTANTLPLISPETPRPSKHCVQLYLNGHAYTYLGLKCSTKPFYCTVNRPQPVYAVFAGRPELSMYSNWQTCAENNPHPLGFSPKEVMSLYDSRQRASNTSQGSKYTMSNKLTMICAPSDKSQETFKVIDSKESPGQSTEEEDPLDTSDTLERILLAKKQEESAMKVSGVQNVSTVPGGYKSNEAYTYVRGRGRGRYVCIECGMRCIKPCTLKKHIRTVHSDVRPFTCRHCMFSFKTKGNLTKHMESKAHFKKCLEKGINPQTPIDDGCNSEDDRSANTASSHSEMQANDDCDTVSDDYSEGDDLEIDMESSDNEDVKLPDHEAAHCLLSLSQRSPCEELNVSPKSLVPSQPTTYPYVQSDLSTAPKVQSNESEFTVIQQHNDFIKNDPTISKINISQLTESNVAASSKTPSEIRLKRISVSSDVIDLSKPRTMSSSSESKDSEPKATTPTSYAGAAELLKSLMTLSDKVPPISVPSYDLTPVSCNEEHSNHSNNMLLQSYLTERALQKSKMKQSQVHPLNTFDDKSSHKFFKESGSAFFSVLSKKLDHIEISPKPRSMIQTNLERGDGKNAESKPKSEKNVPVEVQSTVGEAKVNMIMEKLGSNHAPDNFEKEAVKIQLRIAKSSEDTVDIAKGASDQSGMETLAEIAASSVKLDASKATETPSAPIPNRDTPNSKNALLKASAQNETLSQNEISAKNIASEFLKLANEQDNAVDDSSASSDSDVTETGSKQVRRSSVMPLVPVQDSPLFSARTVVVGEDGFKSKSANANDLPMVALPRGSTSNNVARPTIPYISEDGGPARCTLCPASFPKGHQLVLHMNIHYMNPERKFRCEPCAISFQSQNRLQKHMSSEAHSQKVNTEKKGDSKSGNPRPFSCADCTRAFRIHGHLAKHLRSKTHVQRLENLQKLPFGTYQMIEEARINLGDIDTTDCDNSLASLKVLAEKLKVESMSPDKRKTSSTEHFDSNASSGNQKNETQSPSDNNIDTNTGSLIKKRKLNDGLKETLTISEGDDN